MTTTSRSVCPKCGTIEKSGKASCCGRTGSWFRICGVASNTKRLRHTWYEGILACKTRTPLKTVRAQQPNAAKQSNDSHGTGMGNSKAVIATAETFSLTPANTSTLAPIFNASTTSGLSRPCPIHTPIMYVLYSILNILYRYKYEASLFVYYVLFTVPY